MQLQLHFIHACSTILIPIKIELRVLRTDFPSSSKTHMILTTYTLTFIGFLLNFDVPHKYVIDSSFEPLKCLRCFSSTKCSFCDAYTFAMRYTYIRNKLTSTVTNKFCGFVKKREKKKTTERDKACTQSCEEY